MRDVFPCFPSEPVEPPTFFLHFGWQMAAGEADISSQNTNHSHKSREPIWVATLPKGNTGFFSTPAVHISFTFKKMDRNFNNCFYKTLTHLLIQGSLLYHLVTQCFRIGCLTIIQFWLPAVSCVSLQPQYLTGCRQPEAASARLVEQQTYRGRANPHRIISQILWTTTWAGGHQIEPFLSNASDIRIISLAALHARLGIFQINQQCGAPPPPPCQRGPGLGRGPPDRPAPPLVGVEQPRAAIGWRAEQLARAG